MLPVPRSPLPWWLPATASHGAGTGASEPTKGHLPGSQTGAAAGATAAPALYSLAPISPILASRRRLVTGAGDSASGAAARRARHPFGNEEGARSAAAGAPQGANTRNGARRSARPHGREKPGGCELPPGALIFPVHKSPRCLHQHDGPGAEPVFFLFGFTGFEKQKKQEMALAPAVPRACRQTGVNQDTTSWDAEEKGTGDGKEPGRRRHRSPGMENLEKSGRVWEKATALPLLGLDMPLERGEEALPLTVA